MGGHSVVVDGCDMPDHKVPPDGFGPSARAGERFTAATSARAVAPRNGVCIETSFGSDFTVPITIPLTQWQTG